jgi:hypothetical protein
VEAHGTQVGPQAILEITAFGGRKGQAGAQPQRGGGGRVSGGAGPRGRGRALAAGDALGALFGGAVAGDGRQLLRASQGLLPKIAAAWSAGPQMN